MALSPRNLVRVLGLTVLAAFGVIAARELIDGGGMCVIDWQAMQPLVVGDTARYEIGRTTGSSCVPRLGKFEFSAMDTSKAYVTADGLVRARLPGHFAVFAKRGDVTYLADGFAVPRNWEAGLYVSREITHVGDTIWANAHALDSTGRRISWYVGSVSLQESPGDAHAIFEVVTGPWGARFVALDTGVAVIVGEVKGRRVAEAVTVLPKR